MARVRLKTASVRGSVDSGMLEGTRLRLRRANYLKLLAASDIRIDARRRKEGEGGGGEEEEEEQGMDKTWHGLRRGNAETTATHHRTRLLSDEQLFQ